MVVRAVGRQCSSDALTKSDVVELGTPTLYAQGSVMRCNMMQRMHVAGSMLPFPRLHTPPLTCTPACGWRLRRTRERWAM